MATYAVVGSKDTYDTLEALLPSSGADRVSAVSGESLVFTPFPCFPPACVSDLPKPEYDAIVFSVTADNVKEFTYVLEPWHPMSHPYSLFNIAAVICKQ